MPATHGERLYMAGTTDDAIAALVDRGTQGTPFAGGTWIMRAPIRHEAQTPFYVGLGRIPELHALDLDGDEIRVGACVSHTRLAAALAGIRQCDGLVAAASRAANPAVRQLATIGGNLCAWDFPASDLPPALLCLDATIELHTPGGRDRVPVDRFLDSRGRFDPGTLVAAVVIRRQSIRSGHARLPLRKAGDYPVAIVSMAAVLGGTGVVEDIRIAVGSVEPSARRWPELEKRLLGHPLDPGTAHDHAQAIAGTFIGRDSVEAPGWYRVQVLPALVRRAALAVLADQ